MIPLAATLTWNAPAPSTVTPPAPVGAVRVFDTDLPGLHPMFDSGPIDRRWQDLVFDRLFTKTVAPFASGIVSRAEIGPEAVTVQLVPGIHFQDGRELGPDDVCATVAYLVASGNAGGFAGCDELSDTSARIRFTAPVSDPVVRVGFAVLPAGLSADDLRSDGPFSKAPVGTGPMKAVRGTRGIRFDAAPDAHRPASVVSIELGASGDPLSDLRLLTTGGVDVVIGLPPAVHDKAKAAGCSVVTWTRTSGPGLAVVARAGVKVPAKRTADAPFLDASGWVVAP